MHQMAEVVQQRSGRELVVSAVGLGQRSGLQRVLQLRHRLAAVLLVATPQEQRFDVFEGQHGISGRIKPRGWTRSWCW